jgi:ketosteroid isomerase-like protein
MALSPEMESEVRKMVDLYAQYYHEKSLDKLLSIVSKEISGFGSGPDEIVLNAARFREQVGRDMGQAGPLKVTFEILKVDGVMPCAWVTALCNFSAVVDGKALSMSGRMTVVLRNTGSRWLFEQVHFSMPFAPQLPGQSFPGSS